MFETRKITNDLVVVTYDATEMRIRYSGKKYFRTEECFARIKERKLTINKEVLDKYGIELEVI